MILSSPQSLRWLLLTILGCSVAACGRQPAGKNPATQAPATQTPATQTSATQTPATQTPATQRRAASPPATKRGATTSAKSGSTTGVGQPTIRRDPPRGEPTLWAIDPDASRSVGTPQHGHLLGGLRLPSIPALEVLRPTIKRGWTWGTSELIGLVHDTAITVTREHGGTPMRVGNLSRQGGGDISVSVSHNSGRDVDIAFYLLDAEGKSVNWPVMLHFDANGVVQQPAEARGFRFDTARNWALVRQLLSHPAVVVQWIFVAAPLRNMLLDHALRVGAPASLRQRAKQVLVQPSDSSAHDDHFHVRIACPAEDKPGCLSGPGRTKLAREAQIDALLHMYRQGSPAERRYARELLSVPTDGGDLMLPPKESHAAPEAR